MMASSEPVERIRAALAKADDLVTSFADKTLYIQQKGRHEGLVTEADHALDELLHRELVLDDDGWLSEETVDDGHRLDRRRVWIVDPIDGTRQFIRGQPEWAVSVALTEDHTPIAAGILNPWAEQLFIGSREEPVTLNEEQVRVADSETLDGITVLASRGEVRWGQWDEFHSAPLNLKTMGSIAYKLALVAAGKAEAVVSFEPKNEWDVAAGALLVEAAGGVVTDMAGQPLRYNQKNTLIQGIVAAGPKTSEALMRLFDHPAPRLWRPHR